MARYTGPKHRLARLEGVNILEKTSNSLERRLNIIPGIHGKKGRRKTSEYGLQLREKQKLKRIYGLMEKQFRNYVLQAQKATSNTENVLVELLESRLDNVVYRAGLAKSRTHARQLVSHGHVFVNSKKVTIPSFGVKMEDVVTLDSKMSKFLEEKEEYITLPFIERKNASGKLTRMPKSEEVPNPVDYQLVIEFYSR
jgi:small subunit ribosomal protein S4